MKLLRDFMPLILIISVLWIGFFIINSGLSTNSSTVGSRLIRIIDGDTIVVTIPSWPSVVSNNIPVRIANIDAPERRCIDEWNESREYLIRLMAGVDVVELCNIERGKYFRLIAEVWVDGESLGDRMIEGGYAVEHGSGKKEC